MNAQVTALKCLAAAAVLVFSASIAAACDDYDEEMLAAAAYEAAKLAQSQAPQPAPAQTAAPVTPAGTGVASLAPQQPSGTAQR